MNEGKLIAPTVIPRQVAEIKEAPLESDSFGGVAGAVPGGVAGGVPGGVPGGQMGGVIGGVNRWSAEHCCQASCSPADREGGTNTCRWARADAEGDGATSTGVSVIARQARIQGQVQIDAVLDGQGNVVGMKIVSGPPMLYQAALDALKKWTYEPTYLNEQPIAVQMIVTITFQLGQ
jgi:protein TonB